MQISNVSNLTPTPIPLPPAPAPAQAQSADASGVQTQNQEARVKGAHKGHHGHHHHKDGGEGDAKSSAPKQDQVTISDAARQLSEQDKDQQPAAE